MLKNIFAISPIYLPYRKLISTCAKKFTYLTLFDVGGIYAPPTIQIHFLAELHDRGGHKYTQNLSFVITEHLKLVSGQKDLPTARERPPKLGG